MLITSKKTGNFFLLVTFFSLYSFAESYNSFGHTGLINLPSASIQQEESIFLTFSKGPYTKLGVITVTPFKWLEASFFYHRPDDVLWGGEEGLYLDKGFNVKFSYAPKNNYLPKIAVGLDDFAGTGQLSKEYLVATYNLKNLNVISGIGWGKFAGETDLIYENPLSFIHDSFKSRSISSNSDLGGSPSYDTWFTGDVALFAGIEYKFKKISDLSIKVETDPFNYLDFMCCGEGKTDKSILLREKDSNINYGLSYKYKDFGSINLSYIKGNTWNLSFSLGFSSSKPIVKKDKFKPKIVNSNYNQNQKNEFYLDLLENLNANKLFLQTADLQKKDLKVTIDSEKHIDPIRYSNEAAIISKKVAEVNNYDLEKISISHIIRGTQINQIDFQSKDLDNLHKPLSLIKRDTDLVNPINKFEQHEFRPKVIFPIFINEFAPDLRTHLGSPEKVAFYGIGIKAMTEIQLSRNLVIYSEINKQIEGNFDRKESQPTSALDHVRTEIVDYLQNTSEQIYVTNLHIEQMWSPANDLYAKLSFGLLESMYGGLSSEILYKKFDSRFAVSLELNAVKQRDYDQRFDFLDYRTTTSHFNLAFYEPNTNILFKWSYGRYLAGDDGYTFDLSRRMPSGWNAGVYFTRTDVPPRLFGEGSFDKGFYFYIPHNIFRKNYSKNMTGFSFKPLTRDGGQKLLLKNRLIDSFYGSTKFEINENWKSLRPK